MYIPVWFEFSRHIVLSSPGRQNSREGGNPARTEKLKPDWYKMCLLWLFSGFFAFSVLAADERPPKEGDSSKQKETTARPLYINYGTGTTVTGRLVEETAEHITNTIRAMASAVFKNAYYGRYRYGFFLTERIFVLRASSLSSILGISNMREKEERVSLLQMQELGYLLQHKEITHSERAKRFERMEVKLRDLPYNLWENSFFKRSGVVFRETGVIKETGIGAKYHFDQWAFFEVKGYEGPVVEFADFDEVNTNEIYFLSMGNIDLYRDAAPVIMTADSAPAPVIMQVTGIENKKRADSLELKLYQSGLSVEDDFEEKKTEARLTPENLVPGERRRRSIEDKEITNFKLHFSFHNGGVAVNSEGKVIGFLALAGFAEEPRMHLIKVTPELRRIFSENTAEARGNSRRNETPGCSPPLFL